MTKAAINSAKAPGEENIDLYFGVDEMIGNVTHLRRCFLAVCFVALLVEIFHEKVLCVYTLNTCLCVY